MGVTQVGNDFSARQDIPGYPQRTRSNGVWSKVEKFRIQTALVETNIPAPDAVDSNGLAIRTVDIVDKIEGFPGVSEVTLTWGGEDTSGGASWNGVDNDSSVVYSTETNRQEKNIESHPDWDLLTDEQQKKLRRAYPVFTLVTVTFRATRRRNKRSFTFTEAEIIGNVDKILPPPALADASVKCWMNMGKQITFTKGENIEIVESWQYDKNEWAGTIKSDTNLAAIVAKL